MPINRDCLALEIESFQLKMFDIFLILLKKVQVGKDQEKAKSERDSHSKNRGGKKPN